MCGKLVNSPIVSKIIIKINVDTIGLFCVFSLHNIYYAKFIVIKNISEKCKILLL